MEITTPLVDVLGKFLDLTSTQFKLTSSNVAVCQLELGTASE